MTSQLNRDGESDLANEALDRIGAYLAANCLADAIEAIDHDDDLSPTFGDLRRIITRLNTLEARHDDSDANVELVAKTLVIADGRDPEFDNAGPDERYRPEWYEERGTARAILAAIKGTPDEQ